MSVNWWLDTRNDSHWQRQKRLRYERSARKVWEKRLLNARSASKIVTKGSSERGQLARFEEKATFFEEVHENGLLVSDSDAMYLLAFLSDKLFVHVVQQR